MNIDEIWNLFKKTGEIKYYIEYSKMKKEKM